MLMLKSRNTMIISAVLFLIVVVLLRLAGGFLGGNVANIVASIFAGNAEKVPLIDFATIDLSAFNPMNWSLENFTSDINSWLHDAIDSVLPAVISTVNLTLLQVAIIARSNIVSATTRILTVTL